MRSTIQEQTSYKPNQPCGNKYCNKFYRFPYDPYPKAFSQHMPHMPGTSFTMTISSFLTEKEIPHIYWGTGAWGALGVKEVGEDTQFIVPDHLLNAAAAVLSTTRTAYLVTCPYANRCPIIVGRAWAMPDMHFHINHNDMCLTLDLFKKSSVLWNFPELSLQLPAADSTFTTLASSLQGHRPESRRFACRRVPFHTDWNPVQILTPAATVNALIYLCLKDFGQGTGWISWATNLVTVIRDVLTPEQMDLVEPRFRPVVSALAYHAEGELGIIIRELCEDMLDEDLDEHLDEDTPPGIDITTSWLAI